MNSLSWLIYFAGVVNSFSNVLLMVSVFMAIATCIFWVARGVTAGNLKEYDYPTSDRPEGTPDYKGWVSIAKITKQRWLYFTMVFIWIAVTLIPTEKTLYIIAASEAGEMIVTTPEAKELFDGVHKVIKQNLEELLPK